MSQGAELELVVSEEVGVVGGGEVGRQLCDLGVDGLAAGLRVVVEFGLLLGRQGCGRPSWTPVPAPGSPQKSSTSLLCTKIPPTFKTPTAAPAVSVTLVGGTDVHNARIHGKKPSGLGLESPSMLNARFLMQFSPRVEPGLLIASLRGSISYGQSAREPLAVQIFHQLS